MSIEERGRAAGRATVAVFEANVHVGRDYAALVRRQQQQRRVRLAALAVATAAAVALTFSAGSVLRADQAPVPAPPASRPSPQPLTSALVAPPSLLDVRSLGFHVEPVPGFDPGGVGAGWSLDEDGQTVTLRWEDVAPEVEVRVLYQGEPLPDAPTGAVRSEAVTVHGAPGRFVSGPYGDRPDAAGSFRAALTWEYAPDSWASVSARSDRGDPGPEQLRAALAAVAEAVSAGGDPVRLPIQMPESLPESLPDLGDLTRVGVHEQMSGWEALLEFGRLAITVRLGSVPGACEARGGVVEEFLFLGHAGCTSGEGATDQPPPGTTVNFVTAVALQPDSTVRVAAPLEVGDWFSYHVPEWTTLLHDITVSPIFIRSTWVDVRTAVRG